MITDTRERRLRFAPPQPVGERIVIVDDDYTYFNAINRHGPLPIPFLHAYTPKKNYDALQDRFTKLYNGTEQDDPFLVRPQEQFNSFKARYQHIAYDLSPLSKELLKERGTPLVRRTDPFVHRLFTGTVGASIELGTQGYIERTRILERKNSTLAITLDGKTHVPDDLFGIKTDSARFYWLEVDRNTESLERADKVPNTIDKKFRGALDVLFYEAHKTHWGVPNVKILFITTNLTHKARIMQHLDQITTNRLKNNFLFKTRLEFGRRWEMPAAPFADLIKEPWDTLAGPVYL